MGDRSVVAEHTASLPHFARDSWYKGGPWVAWFLGVPLAVSTGVILAGVAMSGPAVGGLLAAVGVLGGLLVQVLAWIGSRLGALADSIVGRAPDEAEVERLSKLDLLRSNVVYTTFVSLVLVVLLGVFVFMDTVPSWLAWLTLALLVHWVLTLGLIVHRVNSLGRSDRVDALVAGARAKSTPR